jgi:hypothetical protein
MATNPVRLDDLIAHVDRQHPESGPLGRLSEAVLLGGRLGEIADHLIGHFVDEARTAGASWNEIGTSLGVTKQAAQKRFVPRADGDEPDLLAGGVSRFTRPARRALVAAQDGARAMGAPAVSPEHVLFAILAQPGTAAVQALLGAGADPAALRESVAASTTAAPSGDAVDALGEGPAHLPFDADCKKVCRLALRHALRLDSAGVTTGHVLLGLLDADGAARTLLGGAGLRTESVEEWLRRSDPASTGEV